MAHHHLNGRLSWAEELCALSHYLVSWSWVFVTLCCFVWVGCCLMVYCCRISLASLPLVCVTCESWASSTLTYPSFAIGVLRLRVPRRTICTQPMCLVLIFSASQWCKKNQRQKVILPVYDCARHLPLPLKPPAAIFLLGWSGWLIFQHSENQKYGQIVVRKKVAEKLWWKGFKGYADLPPNKKLRDI